METLILYGNHIGNVGRSKPMGQTAHLLKKRQCREPAANGK